MQRVEAATRRQQQFVLMLAFAATCLFERMSFVATASAFENPASTTFEQLASVWNLLHWAIPALLIGTLFTRRVIGAAAAVAVASRFVRLAFNSSDVASKGSCLPESTDLWGMATELAVAVAIATFAAIVVRTVYCSTAIRLKQ